MAWAEISVEQLAQWRHSGIAHTLLDVREDWEIATASMGHDLAIVMSTIPEHVERLRQAKQPLVVLCHAGVRSARVAAFLAEQGIEPVYSLSGGIDAFAKRVDPSIPIY